ncbi:helix-turn-helix domain-containing protein [Vibrio natriegens]
MRDFRKVKGITLAEMAERIQLSMGYVSQVERGVSSLPIPKL